MELLYAIEGLRTPFWDGVFSALTHLGGETVFLVLAIGIFWCVDKRRGYYLLSVGFLGTLANQFLKITCRVPRPWVRDPKFTIVEAARADATGYSFPSGHSTASVGTFGVLGCETERRWVRWVCGALCLLVPFSRMYLGVHTPADVLVGGGISLVCLVVLRPVIYGGHLPKLLGVMAVLACAFVGYMELFPFPADVTPENLHHAVKNSYSLLGALLGMATVYAADKRLDFSTQAPPLGQGLKLGLGLLLALAVKEGLKIPLQLLFGGHSAERAVRYYLLVLFVGILWPMTFPRFAKLGRKDDKR